ncbi:MAG: polysaccharide biosynthesis tyrosine autokinase [Methylocella sp.]
MLQINKRASISNHDSQKNVAPFLDVLNNSARIIRRQLPIVSVIIFCCLALAALYLFITPPKFTATGSMVIDTRKVQILQQQQSVLGDVQIDASTVQTQVEVLKSENVALSVIRKLHLIDDPEFVPPANGPTKGLFSFLFPSATSRPMSESEREQIALAAFQGGLTVSREGLTYVIDLGFTSLNAEKSARIVNTLVESFIEDQLDAKYQAARRAGNWLLERIKELRAQASAAERAVIDFKQQNNLVDTGPIANGPANAARMINDQQLSEVSSQLILASAATAEAKARLDRITTVMSQDVADASLADALKNEVIVKLRQQYLDLAQREAIFAQKYGVNHLATVNLRTQMQEVKHSISDEMRKIAESYKSDYEIARAREQSLKNSLANAVTESQAIGPARAQLRELTANADAARTLYDTFLQRYMEAVQQQDTVPISETRMISPANPPLKKSSPKGALTLLLALAGGGILSFAIAYLREVSDGVLRTSDQVESTLNVNCLAMAPALKIASSRGEAKAADAEGKMAPTDVDFLRFVVDSPFSRYAEAIRSVKIAADLNGALKSHKVIGITSTLPNEGKSTLSANLAHLIADAGGNVILVDADLRSPSLSRWLASDAPGLIDVVIGNISLDAAVTTLPSTRLNFLAAGATAKLPHTNEILASAAMKNLIDSLRVKYDYIIVDLSPVAPIVDVRATGHIIDTYVYVIEWGKTKVDVIERGLSEAQGIYDRMLGVVLNKVDTAAQSRYERYHGNHYYRKYYSKYGYVE